MPSLEGEPKYIQEIREIMEVDEQRNGAFGQPNLDPGEHVQAAQKICEQSAKISNTPTKPRQYNKPIESQTEEISAKNQSFKKINWEGRAAIGIVSAGIFLVLTAATFGIGNVIITAPLLTLTVTSGGASFYCLRRGTNEDNLIDSPREAAKVLMSQRRKNK